MTYFYLLMPLLNFRAIELKTQYIRFYLIVNHYILCLLFKTSCVNCAKSVDNSRINFIFQKKQKLKENTKKNAELMLS